MTARLGGRSVSGRVRGTPPVEDDGYEFPTAGTSSSVSITTVPTFHCLSFYWKATNGATTRDCLVRYRQQGTTTWYQGHSAKFDARSTSGNYATTAARQNEYRGSIVGLTPGVTYQIELYVSDHGEKQSTTATTWSENFPIGSTTTISTNSSSTYTISSGGTSGAYALYNFTNGATIDVAHGASYCIDIQAAARYVIIRGPILKGANRHCINVQTTNADNGDQPLVVIQNGDFSDWGQMSGGFANECDSAVGTPNSSSHFTERVVIDNNKMHHPATDANNWGETNDQGNTHPEGPQAVTIYRPTKQIVIRRNSVYSDDTHMFNDAFGSETGNFSHTGFPNKDSDIYENDISHCWDDGIEAEGANCNVRVWGNRSDLVFNHIANASTSLGPFYAWRNVGLRTQDRPSTSYAIGVGNKNRYTQAASGGISYGGGWCFWYHNTFVRAGTSNAREGVEGCMVSDSYRNTVCKNNILTAWARAIAAGTDPSNTWNYNVRQGSLSVASGQMANAWNANPTYDSTHASGPYTLAEGTSGYQGGEIIPNFSGTFSGAAPDVGAVERGQAAPRFGYIAP